MVLLFYCGTKSEQRMKITALGERKCYITLPILLTRPCDNDPDSQHEEQSAHREDISTAVGVGWH